MAKRYDLLSDLQAGFPGQSSAEQDTNGPTDRGKGFVESIGAVNLTVTPPGDKTVYSVNNVTLGLLRQWTQSTLSSARGDVVEVLFNAAFPDRDHPLTYYGEEGPPLDQTFANIAASLTQHTREQGEIDKWGLSGTAFWPEAYVHARWIWGLLPVIVLILATIFLITTMVVTALRDLPTWRGSALTAIVYGIDREIASAIIGGGPRLQAME